MKPILTLHRKNGRTKHLGVIPRLALKPAPLSQCEKGIGSRIMPPVTASPHVANEMISPNRQFLTTPTYNPYLQNCKQKIRSKIRDNGGIDAMHMSKSPRFTMVHNNEWRNIDPG